MFLKKFLKLKLRAQVKYGSFPHSKNIDQIPFSSFKIVNIKSWTSFPKYICFQKTPYHLLPFKSRASTIISFSLIQTFNPLKAGGGGVHSVYIFRTDCNFLIEFCSSDPSLNRNILRSSHLKFKKSAHAQIITHYWVLFLDMVWI